MAIGTTAAILGSAALGAGSSILGNKAQGDAARNAANASSQATAASIAEQRRQYDQSRQDMMPWLQTGTAGLREYRDLIGLGTAEAQKQAQREFELSADYSVPLQQGLDSLAARNAALGIQDSGAAQKSALRFSQDLASQNFNTYANRLAGISGIGQTAAQNTGAAGQNFANAYTAAQTNNANNLASSYGQQGAASANMWGNLGGIGAGLLGNFSTPAGSPATAPGGSLWGLY